MGIAVAFKAVGGAKPGPDVESIERFLEFRDLLIDSQTSRVSFRAANATTLPETCQSATGPNIVIRGEGPNVSSPSKSGQLPFPRVGLAGTNSESVHHPNPAPSALLA